MEVANPPAGEERIARIEGMLDTFLAEHGRLHADVTRLMERVQDEVRQEHDAHIAFQGDLKWIGRLAAVAVGLLVAIAAAVLGPIVASWFGV